MMRAEYHSQVLALFHKAQVSPYGRAKCPVQGATDSRPSECVCKVSRMLWYADEDAIIFFEATTMFLSSGM